MGVNTSTLLLVLNTSRSNGPWSDEVSGLFLMVCLFLSSPGKNSGPEKKEMEGGEDETDILIGIDGSS